jgi:hypothetical protein
MKNIDYNDANRKGVIISVEKVSRDVNLIFPKQDYDWKSIEKILEEYAGKVMLACDRPNERQAMRR